MSKRITALFESPIDAAHAIDALEIGGIRRDQISLVAGEGFQQEAFGIETHSKMPEGAAIGAAGGGAAAAIVAGLSAVGAIATGTGLVAAGPLVAALAGAGAGAAGGSVIGGLIGYAIPEHEVKHYDDALERGSVLVAVECENSDTCDGVRKVFEDCNADTLSTA